MWARPESQSDQTSYLCVTDQAAHFNSIFTRPDFSLGNLIILIIENAVVQLLDCTAFTLAFKRNSRSVINLPCTSR